MPISGPPIVTAVDPVHLLAAGLAAQPESNALAGIENRWSWRELEAASQRLAGNYLALGLRPGDRVASLMPNRTVLVVHYLACFKAGLAATPLNYRYTPREIDHALTVSEAAILVAHADRDADLAASAVAARLRCGVVRFAAAPGGPERRLEAMIALPPAPAPPLPTPAPDWPSAIFFTSGSTGLPKGVTHTYRTTAAMLAAIIDGLAFRPADVVLPGSSLSHQGGYGLALAALAAGARLVVPRTVDGDELVPLLRRERPTVLWMLPAALITFIREHRATRDDFRSLRLCLAGGDKVPAQAEAEFTAIAGLAIDECYGMTEIGGATRGPPGGRNKPGSIGQPFPGMSLAIRDDDGREVGIDRPGRLWARSPAVTAGYWGNPEATRATIVDGWLDTGDVMRVDADGYFWFCGRKKQIIVHDGSNIAPQEVEEALIEHPAVAAAGVVGIHDLVHGENVRAYVTLQPGVARPSSQELIRFARARIGYKAPESIVFLPQMPLNATGKLDRVALKALAAEPPPDPAEGG